MAHCLTQLNKKIVQLLDTRCGWVSGEKQEERSRHNAARSDMSPESSKGASVGSLLWFVRRLPVAPHQLGACSRSSGGFRLVVCRAASVGSPLSFVRRVPVLWSVSPHWLAIRSRSSCGFCWVLVAPPRLGACSRSFGGLRF
jgi:hypothetical protein